MQKVKHFLAFSRFSLVFRGFSPEFQSTFGLNINHTCQWQQILCIIFFVAQLALIIRGIVVHFSSYLSTSPE
jgi:hypothetical protein